ncbi:DNA-binding response regulator [Paracidovorax citrulli]
MIKAIVVEDHPLIALGLERVLGNMPDIDPVQCIEPSAIVDVAHSLERMLIVYGMSDESAENCALLRQLHKRLPNAAIVVLSQNIWPRMPSALDGCGIADHLPKTASVERIEAAIEAALSIDGARPAVQGRRCWPAERAFPAFRRGMLRMA